MVARFSQRYEASGYKATIDRERIGRSHAYKPRRFVVENLYLDVVPMRRGEKFPEGAVQRVLVSAYERNGEARDRRLAKYGLNCNIYGLFGDAFSSISPDAGDLHFQLVLELYEALRI